MAEKWTYRCQYIRCGKKNCRSCPHGPYWYGFRSEAGKTRSKYFGRIDPRGDQGRAGEAGYRPIWEPILSASTASEQLAYEILGIETRSGQAVCKTAYRYLIKIHHPDRGGDHLLTTYITAAWTYLCKKFAW